MQTFIHTGVLSFTEMNNEKPTNAWYLVSAASMAILLLPFVATPLTWVAVELLTQQARDSAPARSSDEVATDTTDIELHYREGRNPPERKNDSVFDSGNRTQSEEHMTEEGGLPNSPYRPASIVATEGTSPSARMISSNSETAVVKEFQSSLDEPSSIVDATEVVKRRPTALLKTRQNPFMEAEIYDVQFHRLEYSKFQRLNTPACAMMYAGLMCFSLSFMCCEFLYTVMHE